MIFRRHRRHSVVEINHFLVVAIHKIHFKSFDSHLAVVLAHMLHVSVDGIISCPKHKPDVAFVGVCYKFFKIYFRHHLEQISLLVHSPSFVQNHIFYTVFRCEIYVIFIGVVVDASLEVDTPNVPVVPPVPGHLSWLDPAHILNSRRRRELVNHVVVHQLGVVFRNHHRSPREIAFSFYLCDVVFSFFYNELQHIVTALLLNFRICRLHRFQAVPFAFAEKRSRIIFQIRFHNHNFLSVFNTY